MNLEYSNMTEEQLIKFVIGKLLDQGEPSLLTKVNGRPAQQCQYITELASGKTLKCAAGHLLPDNLCRDLSGGWVSVVAHYGLPTTHKDLITSLQMVHDDAAVDGLGDSWRKALQIAFRKSLPDREFPNNTVIGD